MVLLSSCTVSIKTAGETIDYATISSITPNERKYYFNDNTNTLVHFAKGIDIVLYNLVFVHDGHEKENMLSLPSIPQSSLLGQQDGRHLLRHLMHRYSVMCIRTLKDVDIILI